MEDKIILTVFTDPMMGLSYESEPIMERLQIKYGDRLEIRYVMSVLVRDVSDFMTRSERSMEPEAGIRRCCKRLAQIYKSNVYATSRLSAQNPDVYTDRTAISLYQNSLKNRYCLLFMGDEY